MQVFAHAQTIQDSFTPGVPVCDTVIIIIIIIIIIYTILYGYFEKSILTYIDEQFNSF